MEMDEDHNGKLTLDEFRHLHRVALPDQRHDPQMLKSMFDDIDKDGNGQLDPAEILAYLDITAQEIATARAKRPKDLKEWIWFCVECDEVDWEAGGSVPEGDARKRKASQVYRFLSYCFILMSVVVLFLESMPDYQNMDLSEPTYTGSPGNSVTSTLEAVCVIFFMVEFAAYILTFPYQRQMPDTNWWSIFLRRDTYIHILSITPWFLELVFDSGSEMAPLVALRATRMVRVMRVLRALGVGQGPFSKIPALTTALKEATMSLLVLFNLIAITCVLSASLIYLAEGQEGEFDFTTKQWRRKANSTYPDAGELLPYQSIPSALWWALVTVTTVGYGDKYPVTIWGKLVASATMFWSICMMAYPVTILGSVFANLADKERETGLHRQFCKNFYDAIREWLKKDYTVTTSKEPARPALDSIMAPVMRVLEDITGRLDKMDAQKQTTYTTFDSPQLDGAAAPQLDGAVARCPTTARQNGGVEARMRRIDSQEKRRTLSPPKRGSGGVERLLESLREDLAALGARVQRLESQRSGPQTPPQSAPNCPLSPPPGMLPHFTHFTVNQQAADEEAVKRGKKGRSSRADGGGTPL